MDDPSLNPDGTNSDQTSNSDDTTNHDQAMEAERDSEAETHPTAGAEAARSEHETHPTPGAGPVRYEVEPPAAAGGGVARAASLLVIGVLVGLGAGWILFHEEAGAGAAAQAEPLGDGSAAESHGVDVTNDPVLGSEGAPVTIVEFSDFDCPFCTRFATQTAPLLRRHYGDRVRWVFVNLPLRSLHPRAYDAALAGECAHAQEGFWAWYDAMFSGQFDSSERGLTAAARSIGLDADRFEQCLERADYASEVAADLREAEKFYIFGTPTFFINGQRLEGAQPPEAFATVIDSILSGP
ncbi:MAG: DsbA family protein [Gemmatimonadota bacterium]